MLITKLGWDLLDLNIYLNPFYSALVLIKFNEMKATFRDKNVKVKMLETHFQKRVQTSSSS